MKIVFMGTPDFAVPTLEALYQSRHEVAAVVTQPDKPKGRGKAMAACLSRKSAGIWNPGVSAGARPQG